MATSKVRSNPTGSLVCAPPYVRKFSYLGPLETLEILLERPVFDVMRTFERAGLARATGTVPVSTTLPFDRATSDIQEPKRSTRISCRTWRKISSLRVFGDHVGMALRVNIAKPAAARMWF